MIRKYMAMNANWKTTAIAMKTDRLRMKTRLDPLKASLLFFSDTWLRQIMFAIEEAVPPIMSRTQMPNLMLRLLEDQLLRNVGADLKNRLEREVAMTAQTRVSRTAEAVDEAPTWDPGPA